MLISTSCSNQSLSVQYTENMVSILCVPKQPRPALTTGTELIYNHLCSLEMFSSGTSGHEMSQLENGYFLTSL